MFNTNDQKVAHKDGPKWSNDRFFASFEEATNRVKELSNTWTENNQEHMQTKIKRRPDARFIVKYRKDPAHTVKENKNGNRNRKNKRSSKNRKLNSKANI